MWGAFAYVDALRPASATVSRAERGYLYFRVRSDISGFTSEREVEINRREWADLKALVGPPSYLYERKPSGGARADLRVRPANESPAGPATYETEMGIVKLRTPRRTDHSQPS